MKKQMNGIEYNHLFVQKNSLEIGAVTLDCSSLENEEMK